MKHVLLPVFELLLTFLFLAPVVNAQSGPPDMSFGSVTPAAFASTPLDTNANAVFLFDHGVTSFDPNNASLGYSVVYERHVRIHILNSNGLGLATVAVSAVHKSSYKAYIDEIRGATYNLEDGKVVTTKLDKSNIFKDKNNDYDIRKLAFPNVRPGSVIEYSFRIVYPSYHYIPDWEFQRGYPVLWSQYEVTVPNLFDYFVRNQGYRPFTVDTTLDSATSFPIGFAGGVRGVWSGATVHRIWALRDVTPLERPEPYTTTLRNHVQKVQFQLSGVRYDTYSKTYRTTWPELTAELLKNPYFGESLRYKNRWLEEGLKKIAPRGDRSSRAAQKLFAFVRDQFTCTATEGIYQSQPMKKTWEDRKGTVADLNLLLTAIYRHQGFEASPVLLSTRDHGYPVEGFPMLNDYNYVVVRVRAGGQYYLADASKPTTGFGQLPEPCYNAPARAIDSSGDVVPLLPDSVTERRFTRINLANDSAGDLSGTYLRQLGVFESMQMRARLKREKPADFFGNLRKSMPEYRQMGASGFDSLSVPELPLSWHYDMSYHFTQKTIYFNPILHERMNNSPLSSPERYYPVEMPYQVDNNYALRMDIPSGYVVGQLPKSARFTMEDSSCSFDYIVTTDGRSIEFHTRLQLKKTYYPVEQYQGLRNFFALVVRKEKEPFIFKKAN